MTSSPSSQLHRPQFGSFKDSALEQSVGGDKQLEGNKGSDGKLHYQPGLPPFLFVVFFAESVCCCFLHGRVVVDRLQLICCRMKAASQNKANNILAITFKNSPLVVGDRFCSANTKSHKFRRFITRVR